jgi:hypothetical protein
MIQALGSQQTIRYIFYNGVLRDADSHAGQSGGQI